MRRRDRRPGCRRRRSACGSSTCRFAVGVALHVARWDADVPVLLIHGTADATVPDEPTVELADKLGGRARLLHPPGVDHVGLRDTDPARYRAALARFLDTALDG